MKLLVVIFSIFVALVASASAGLPTHPGQLHSSFVSHRVCDVASFQTARTPVHKHITIGVSVAGKQIPVIGGNGSNTLDSAGNGVFVRIIQSTRRSAPLQIHAASVRRDCARVNVLATWR